MIKKILFGTALMLGLSTSFYLGRTQASVIQNPAPERWCDCDPDGGNWYCCDFWGLCC
jgi:hypothetical protein